MPRSPPRKGNWPTTSGNWKSEGGSARLLEFVTRQRLSGPWASDDQFGTVSHTVSQGLPIQAPSPSGRRRHSCDRGSAGRGRTRCSSRRRDERGGEVAEVRLLAAERVVVDEHFGTRADGHCQQKAGYTVIGDLLSGCPGFTRIRMTCLGGMGREECEVLGMSKGRDT